MSTALDEIIPLSRVSLAVFIKLPSAWAFLPSSDQDWLEWHLQLFIQGQMDKLDNLASLDRVLVNTPQ